MKNTLRSRLIKWFSSRPNEVISGGEMEKIVGERTTYKASNVSRRLRELSEEGILMATYEKGFVCYQWNMGSLTAMTAKVLLKAINPRTILASQLKSAREQTEMAKVQLTLV